MIVKGKLVEFGKGFRDRKSTGTKFDYITIGETRIKKITISSYLLSQLEPLVGEQIEVSFIKGLWPAIGKQIVAIKDKNGNVTKNDRSSLIQSTVVLVVIILLSLLIMALPYFFIGLILMSFLSQIESFNVIPSDVMIALLSLHFTYLIFKFSSMFRSANAFGAETKKFKEL